MDLIVGGKEWSGPDLIEVRFPWDARLVDKVPCATPAVVDRALDAARRGARIMRTLTTAQRYEILFTAAQLVDRDRESLAKTMTLETGKLLAEARVEIGRVKVILEFAAEEAKRLGGEVIPTDYQPWGEGKLAFYRHMPKGVISCISPFNFPALLSMHKIAPAIGAGNAVVAKPPPVTPLTVLSLGRLLLEAGLPPEALSVITGHDAEIGHLTVADPRIDMVSFTGSRRVGEIIRREAGLKPVTLELGSNAAVICDRDTDLEQVVSAVVRGGCSNAGQVCISVQRVYVHASLYAPFVERAVAITRALRVGDPFAPDTDVAPMCRAAEAARVREWLDEAVAAGARVHCGGEAHGHKFQPAIVTDARPGMKIIDEELFGPVVCILPVSSMAEAYEAVNASQYGLNAAIFTRDIRTALQAIDEVHVGTMLVNHVPGWRVENMPYGGVKHSGIGREGLRFAIQDMSDIRLAVFQR